MGTSSVERKIRWTSKRGWPGLKGSDKPKDCVSLSDWAVLLVSDEEGRSSVY